jgi:hypothetical protein
MKKVFLFTTAMVLLAAVFSSCKKNKTETTTQKLQHNWTLVSIIDNSHDASGDDIVTTTATAGDFMNFNANGTATFQFDATPGTVSYSIISDTEILLATETFTVKTLTNTQLVLYVKDVISATDYDEETINLKR